MTNVKNAPAMLEAGGHTWYSVEEAARRIGVTPGRVYHLTSAGRLLVHTGQPHGLTYVRADSIERYKIYRKQLQELRKTGRALSLAK